MTDDLIGKAEANIQIVKGSSNRAITSVMDAHDEMLCRVVLRAVQDGADEAQWL